jgi:ABC-type amino acid transport system permease subunit
MWRGEIGLATRLLGVSAHGLVANGGIILATVLLNLASIVAIVPLCVFLGAWLACLCMLGVSEIWYVGARAAMVTHVLQSTNVLLVHFLSLFAGFSFMNGEVVPNPSRDPSARECVDGEGQEVLCCSWEPNSYGKAYLCEPGRKGE